ncbi:MAG: hypothetical protein LUD27_01035 [Clostridia bacterium]|nr:hypothetical protein [Clostridia bacterium]
MFISKAYNYIRSSASKSNNKKIIATMAVVLFVALIGGRTSSTDSVTVSLLSGEIFMLVSCFCVISISPTKKGYIDLRSVLPVKAVRRTAYAYVLPIVLSVLCFIAWILICIAVWSAFGIIVWIISGENPFVFESTESFNTYILSGELAVFFRFVAAYSLSQIVSHMQGKWWIPLIAQAVVLVVWTEIPILLTESEGVSYSFYNSFGVMPSGWIFVLISGVISLAILAASIFFVYKTYKPKDF